MKKITILLLLLVHSISYSQGVVSKKDSLKSLLIESNGTRWIDIAIELGNETCSDDFDYSNTLIDDAIELSQNLNYQKGLGNAYQIKGKIAYIDDKTITGITYYGQSADIFTKLNLHRNTAKSLIGMANGFIRMHKNIEAKDTLLYTLAQYSDSLTPETKSIAYHLLANAYRGEGINDLASNAIDSSIKIEKAHNLLKQLTKSYNYLGVMCSDIGDYKKSIQCYNLSEETARKNNDTLYLSYAIHNKAILYLDWGIYDESLKLFLESKNLLQLLKKDDELVGSFSSIAIVYYEIGDLVAAKQYYYKSIEMADKYNDMNTKYVSYHNLGELLFQENKPDSALSYLNKSLRYEMAENNAIGIAESKSEIASVYSSIGKYNMAFTYFNEAEKTFEKFDNKQGLADLYIEYAKTHEKLNNDSLSVLYFEKGIKLATTINDRKLMLDGYKEASENYENLGQYEKALQYYKNYKQLSDSLFNETSKSHVDYMTLVLENQNRDKKLAQLANDQKVTKLENKNRSQVFITAIIVLIVFIIFFVWRYNLKRRSELNLSQQYNTLLETEQKVKALLDASFDSTLLADTNGIILTANNNSLNGFFEDVDSLIHKDILSFFSATNVKVLRRFIELVLITKSHKDIQVIERNKTQLNIKISPVVNMKMQVTSLAFYIKDVTQIERDKEEKIKMQSQLIQTQKMETVGTLAGGIAHDFNNYLATISGYISMSLEDTDPESHVFRYLKNTKKAVVLAQGTVKKLLAFSRSNDVVFDKVQLNELIKDSVDMVKGSQPKHIKLTYPTLNHNYEILADKNQMTQVIINICTNAFHAIGAEKGNVEIIVSETDSHKDFINQKMLKLSIKDSGIGMEKESQERVFEPFYTTKEVGKGTGLGLSVVAGIIKQHKGKIEVQSKFGKGSTFTIYLPMIS